jgi:putative transposase
VDPESLRLQLIDAVRQLPTGKLQDAMTALRQLANATSTSTFMGRQLPADVSKSSLAKDWPHAPLHRLSEHGTYMVTTGTLRKAHIFHTPDRLDFLESQLLSFAASYGWRLEAWAVFSNHYHFIGCTRATPSRLREFLTELHANTAREINLQDGTKGRQVWYNFWDKQLTYEKSYLARLKYVHHNAVKHGLTTIASAYPWCSAAGSNAWLHPRRSRRFTVSRPIVSTSQMNLSRWQLFAASDLECCDSSQLWK